MSKQSSEKHVKDRLIQRYNVLSVDAQYSKIKKYIKRGEYDIIHTEGKRSILKINTWQMTVYCVYDKVDRQIKTVLTEEMIIEKGYI